MMKSRLAWLGVAWVASACAPQAVEPVGAPTSPPGDAPPAQLRPTPTLAPSGPPSPVPSPSPEARYGQLVPRNGVVGFVGSELRYEEALSGRGASGEMLYFGFHVPQGLIVQPPELAEEVASSLLRLKRPGTGAVRTRLGGYAPLLVHALGHEPLPWLERNDAYWPEDSGGLGLRSLAWLEEEAAWGAWWQAWGASLGQSKVSPPDLPSGFSWAQEGILIFRMQVGTVGELPFFSELPKDGVLRMKMVRLDGNAPLPASRTSIFAHRLPREGPWRRLELTHSYAEPQGWPIPEGGASGAWPDAPASAPATGDPPATGEAGASLGGP